MRQGKRKDKKGGKGKKAREGKEEDEREEREEDEDSEDIPEKNTNKRKSKHKKKKQLHQSADRLEQFCYSLWSWLKQETFSKMKRYFYESFYVFFNKYIRINLRLYKKSIFLYKKQHIISWMNFHVKIFR